MKARGPAVVAGAIGLALLAGAVSLPADTAQRGQPPASPSGPALVVILVVDQMRADYVDRFRNDWTAGLKRLFTGGAWFSNAAYPYLTTVTCSGHATVATGAFPHVHGIFSNAWYDRARARTVACTEDPAARPVTYGGRAGGAYTSARLLIPTFADEMRRQQAARVVTLSLKARSAIMLAGRGGDAVTWLNESLDGWETSSQFTSAPIAAVKQFVEAHPIDADYGKTWARLLPLAKYVEPDEGEGEDPPNGWTPLFPHVLKGDSADKEPDNDFYEQWQNSPFADAYLGRFAAALTESFRLGQHDGTDVLAVSFSSPDLVGHGFGPHSQEVRDLYVHLDRTVGSLLGRLDALVGRGRYVVVLTSDHGVAAIPEQQLKAGRDAGRLSPIRMAESIERIGQEAAAAGPRRFGTVLSGNDVYFAAGEYERLMASPPALTTLTTAIADMPGVARVFRSDQLAGAVDSPDERLRAAALSYVPGRSGDLVLALKPGWMWSAAGTTHGSWTADDQRVPILFLGQGITPGEYREPTTPADIAPTLAALSGITLPRAEGRSLHSALAARAITPGGQR